MRSMNSWIRQLARSVPGLQARWARAQKLSGALVLFGAVGALGICGRSAVQALASLWNRPRRRVRPGSVRAPLS